MANVTVQALDRIFVVTINRPHKRNAVDGVTAKELYDAFKQFDRDDGLSVAILTGTEGSFCSGADLQAIAKNEKVNPLLPDGDMGPMGVTRLRLSKPVIAAIEGYAVAGGLELALWCDLRVMASNATLGVFCRRHGVPLIDLGTIRLPRLIGQSRAMDLLLTGRPVDAEEALGIGLVNRVSAPGAALEKALELADLIASYPQTCMRNDRLSMLEQWGMSEEDAWKNEFNRGMTTIQSGETQQGAKRFSEK